MGVEYYGCECCGESRYEEYVDSCGECQNRLCTWCLVNNDLNSRYAHEYGIRYDGSDEMKEEYGIEDDWEEKGWIEIDGIIDDTGIDSKYCPFCQGNKVSKEDLFDWYLNKKKLDYEVLKAEYLKEKINR